MSHRVLYKKCKANSAAISPFFSKGNLPWTMTIVIAAVLVEPLILYKYHRSGVFSLDYYIHQLEMLLIVVTPVTAILCWMNWREIKKQNNGYKWVGRFEVLAKESSFLFCYLLLDESKIRVDRALFQKTKVGDSIIIHRDSFGKIEEVEKVNNLASRVARLAIKRARETSRTPVRSLAS